MLPLGRDQQLAAQGLKPSYVAVEQTSVNLIEFEIRIGPIGELIADVALETKVLIRTWQDDEIAQTIMAILIAGSDQESTLEV